MTINPSKTTSRQASTELILMTELNKLREERMMREGEIARLQDECADIGRAELKLLEALRP